MTEKDVKNSTRVNLLVFLLICFWDFAKQPAIAILQKLLTAVENWVYWNAPPVFFFGYKATQYVQTISHNRLFLKSSFRLCLIIWCFSHNAFVAMFSWKTLGPSIWVDSALICTIYLKIVADTRANASGTARQRQPQQEDGTLCCKIW